MTGADSLRATMSPRPAFRGSLADQKPHVFSSFGADPWLLIAVAALLGIGVVMVYNVSYFYAHNQLHDPSYFFRRHIASIVIGTIACIGASYVPSAYYRKAAYPLLAVALLGMLIVLVPWIGVVRGGARRWLSLGFLGWQPSEIAKFALVLYLAHSLSRRGEQVREFVMGVLPHCVVAGTIAVLSLLEPDFGTAALCGTVLMLMLFAGGARAWHLGGMLAVGVPLVYLVLTHSEYRLRRLMAFVDPNCDPLKDCFQLRQSFIAFGSGQLFGQGLGNSGQKRGFLPAAHTDFIFSVVGEELGLIGAVVVIGLFAVLAVRGFRIALRHPDPFASLLGFGITSALMVQGLINMAVVLGCLPTKGLTLPFLSYGGSAMTIVMAEVGVLLSLAREAG
jgi:cell division protein FtsW